MAASVYSKNLLLDLLLRGTGTPPAAWHVGLLNGVDDEVDGTGYARVAATFLAAIAGVARNATDLSFGVADADWGAVTSFGVWDASSSGNLLLTGTLNTFTPDGVQELIIRAGELEVSVE